jgi:ubiquinone/menaquinone biosynthesis C-methylase UbiE
VASSPIAPPAPAQPFDAVAASYDAAFSQRRLGRWLRAMVWQRLERAFTPGQHVLELGCGTGEDAVWLARRGVRVTATDVSAPMLAVTRQKAEAAGVGARVTVARLDLAALPSAGLAEEYDGVVSSFGPLNCVEDRRAVAGALAGGVRPGGRLVLVVMGPICPWEIAWHLGHGQVRTALRRFRAGAPARVGSGRRLRVWYPSPGRLRREFAPYFRTLEVAGIGLLLPPSAMGGLVERAPRLFGLLAAIDRRLATTLPWRMFNDHYLMVLERR